MTHLTLDPLVISLWQIPLVYFVTLNPCSTLLYTELPTLKYVLYKDLTLRLCTLSLFSCVLPGIHLSLSLL